MFDLIFPLHYGVLMSMDSYINDKLTVIRSKALIDELAKQFKDSTWFDLPARGDRSYYLKRGSAFIYHLQYYGDYTMHQDFFYPIRYLA